MTNDVNALEREIEQTRERLADTLDQLLHRANPKTIVSREVTSIKSRYIDLETGAPKTDAILRAAGIAVGVVVAFVVVRKIVR